MTWTASRSGEDGSPRGARTTRLLSALALGLALLPLLLCLLQFASSRWPTRLDGDLALLELGVRDALRLDQPLGLYSRFGWSHPGPALLVTLAPLYRIADGTSGALFLGAILINLGAAILAVRLVAQSQPDAVRLLFAGAIFSLQMAMGGTRLASPWPPFQVVLPMLLFLVLAAQLAEGRLPRLLPCLVAASFLVQTHLGTLPIVALVLATAAGSAWRSVPRRDPQRAPLGRRHLVLGVAVLVALWLPPIVAETRAWLEHAEPGNLAKIAGTFLASPEPRSGWSAGWALVEAKTNGLLNAWLGYFRLDRPLALLRLPASFEGSLGLSAMLLALPLCLFCARRREDTSRRAWIAVALAAQVGALSAAAAIVGRPFEYLVTFSLAITAFCAVAVLASLVALLVRRFDTRLSAPATSLVIVGLLVSGNLIASRRFANQQLAPRDRPDVGSFIDAVQLAVPGKSACVRLGTWGDSWVPVAGTVLGLDKADRSVFVHPRLAWMFGEAHLKGRGVCAEVRAAGPGFPLERWPLECRRELAASDRATVVLLAEPSTRCSDLVAAEISAGFW